MNGSQYPSVLSRLKKPCTLLTSADWNTVKVAFTCGILAASAKPPSTSFCLTSLRKGPRSTLTVSFSMLTALL